MAVTYRLKHVGINCENEAEAKKLVAPRRIPPPAVQLFVAPGFVAQDRNG